MNEGHIELQEKSRMELMQEKMDDVLDKVISGAMDLDRAKVVNSMFQTMINSANAQTSFYQRTGVTPVRHAALPAPKPAVEAIGQTETGLVKTTTDDNGIRTVVHQLGG